MFARTKARSRGQASFAARLLASRAALSLLARAHFVLAAQLAAPAAIWPAQGNGRPLSSVER